MYLLDHVSFKDAKYEVSISHGYDWKVERGQTEYHAPIIRFGDIKFSGHIRTK